MIVSPPTLPDNHPDRPLSCEEALAENFYRIAESAGVDETCSGDESAFWPLRKSARAAGWEIAEIDAAIFRLAGTLPFALEPARPE